ncbi:MAG: VTT domain-containing protein [Candidatus Pacebacteria bacterium]|nr:VTT domain-containing protein [Candidatus Paceibacterota bacterium]
MNWFIELIKQNGRTSVFLGGLLEEIIIPIPSPLVSITAGAFLIREKAFWPALGEIFFKVSLPFALGATIGCSLAYFLAFFGGKLMIKKTEKYLGFSWKIVEKTREKFIKGTGDELAIVLLRAAPVVPVSLISVVCGAVRYDPKSFYLSSFLGLILRSFFLGIIGWQTGSAYQSWIEGLDKAETIISVAIVLILAGALGFFYLKRDKFFKK